MIIILQRTPMHQGYLNLFNYIHDKVLWSKSFFRFTRTKMDYQTGQPNHILLADYPTEHLLENIEDHKIKSE